MRELFSYGEFINVVNEFSNVLIYTYSPTCNVCHADLPKIEDMVNNQNFTSFKVNIKEVPELAGQLTLFSSPTVILFNEGKEYHRQVRLIDFKELEYRILQLKEYADAI
ncbi:TPA: thioredoxin family protein [Listeria monocytogenes]